MRMWRKKYNKSYVTFNKLIGVIYYELWYYNKNAKFKYNQIK